MQLGVGRRRIARISDRGPCVAGVRMRKVRAVSIGDRRIADSEEEMKDRTSVANGEVAVRISAVIEDEISSSGRPIMADKRLRIKVFRVGRSREYIKVALVAFHGDVGPLVVQSCDSTSIREDGFLIDRACLEDDAGGGI